MAFKDLAARDDLWPGELLALSTESARVLLVNVDDSLCAYADRCQHLGLSLAGARLDGNVLTCPHHGWSYDARTGAGLNPAGGCLKRLALRVEAGRILVDVAAMEDGLG